MLLDLHLGDGDGRDLLASLGDERPPVALFTGSEVIGPELRGARRRGARRSRSGSTQLARDGSRG